MHHIRPIRLNRTYVSSFDFSAPTTIDEFQAGNRASFVICMQNKLSKHSVADGPRRKKLNTLALLLKNKWRRIFGQTRERKRGIGTRK